MSARTCNNINAQHTGSTCACTSTHVLGMLAKLMHSDVRRLSEMSRSATQRRASEQKPRPQRHAKCGTPKGFSHLGFPQSMASAGHAVNINRRLNYTRNNQQSETLPFTCSQIGICFIRPFSSYQCSLELGCGTTMMFGGSKWRCCQFSMALHVSDVLANVLV